MSRRPPEIWLAMQEAKAAINGRMDSDLEAVSTNMAKRSRWSNFLDEYKCSDAREFTSFVTPA